MGCMINYNLVLYIGIAFYALIFFTFIAYQMHDRKKDREQWRLTQSYNKAKNDNR
jgi:sortase (surface protein transpeptidase)